MRIAITASGPTLNDRVDPRFGRCSYYLFVDTETGEIESLKNPNFDLATGAGITSGQLMSQKGVKVVLTGNCGPNAMQVFDAAGIRVITGITGSASEALEKFKAGKLESESTSSSGQSPGTGFSRGIGGGFGMGRGMGRGMGMGGRCGMGRGMGRGMGMGGGRMSGMGGATEFTAPARATPYPTPTEQKSYQQPAREKDRKKEIRMLKAKLNKLEEELKIIKGGTTAMPLSHAKVRFVATVDPQLCQGCGLCEEICPESAIFLGEVAQVNSAQCTGCGECAAECPEGAISLKIQPR